MKKLLFCIFMGSLILMLGCSENSPLLPGDDPSQEATKKSAKKPMAKLVGYTEEALYVDMITGQPYSIGTITFGDCDTYGLVYKILEMNQKGHVMFLTETFYIFEDYGWDITDPDFNIQEVMALDVLMTGTNSGVSPNNMKFITNGTVSEASGDFEGWAGRNVHVQGDIVGPAAFTSTFRVN